MDLSEIATGKKTVVEESVDLKDEDETKGTVGKADFDSIQIKKTVKILYTNWKGETSVRNIIPERIEFLSNEWHKEEQWCLVAFDIDKRDFRTFACKDIKSWFLK